MFRNNPPRPHFARLRTLDTDIPVSEHAAYDIKDMDALRRQGIPISNDKFASQYFDGSDNATFDLPLDQMRGVDINDVWNESKRVNKALSKSKVSKFNINPTQTS